MATSDGAKYMRLWLTNLTHPESVSEVTNYTYYYYYYCRNDNDGYVSINL
jgi:hypothetical protein